MSTKIHNGRLLQGPIGEIYELVLGAKPEVQRLKKHLQEKWLANRAVEAIDEARLKGQLAKAPLREAWLELQARKLKSDREQRRDPSIDFDFSLWLFPRRTTTLCIVQTEQKAYRDWFDGLGFVKDYAFWNNTDRPGDVPEDEWEKRRRDWDEVLPGAGCPADRCLTFSLVNGSYVELPVVTAILEHQPSTDVRLRRLVEAKLVDEHYTRMVEKATLADPGVKLPVIELFFKASHAATQDVARRSEIEAQISPIIRPVTADELLGSTSSSVISDA